MISRKIKSFYICELDKSIDIDTEVDASASNIDMKLHGGSVVLAVCLLKNVHSLEPVDTYRGMVNLNTI